MIDRAKRAIAEYKTALLVILCLLIVCVAYAIGRHSVSEQTATEKPAVMTQEQTQDAERLRAKLDISERNAAALQRKLADVQAGQRAPTVTYHVTAPTVERAAQVVERQIREDDPTLPRAAREKTDRTVVTPITKDKDGKQLPTEEQKLLAASVDGAQRRRRGKQAFSKNKSLSGVREGFSWGKWEILLG